MVSDPALAFVRTLEKSGVEVELEVWPDMVHDFHLLAAYHPLGKAATEKLAAFLVQHLPPRD